VSSLEPDVRSSKNHLLAAWFPGAKFKRDAEVSYKEVGEMCNVPFEAVKKSMVISNLFIFVHLPHVIYRRRESQSHLLSQITYKDLKHWEIQILLRKRL